MSATYLLYARSGQEIPVRDELRLRSVDVWMGLTLEGIVSRKRSGRDRRRQVDWSERPSLPNYLWAHLSPHQYDNIFRDKPIKYLARTATIVPWTAERDLRRFQEMVDKEYKKARTAMERDQEPPPVFDAGQRLETIGGPLAGLTASFRRIVEDAEGYHVEADGPLGIVKLNPRDVRAAE